MAFFTRVIRAMEKISPISLAEHSWDNVGKLIEPPYPRHFPSRVLLTIDLTPLVLEEALADKQIGVIIAYHPPIFRPIKRLNLDNAKQAIVLKCVAQGIGVFSPHTASDSCVGGVNDWLAKGLGAGTIKPIAPAQNPPEGLFHFPILFCNNKIQIYDQLGHEEAGTGRMFTLDQPAPLSTIIERVKQHLKLRYVRVATTNKHSSGELISTIGICAGSGSSVLLPATADLYFTGEMSHHDILAALDKNTSVILCEHSNTERGYLSEVLKPKLEQLLKEGKEEKIDVVVSKVDKDPLETV
ncbi:NGG1p interacting factor 3 [Rhizophagus irregularis]|uniref:NGG1p interacting factor 3 n=2 Tax=Rhizophagus irregularis TaxID=588596 RepID=A0A2N0P495_9GLOM|nr:Nif3p [Rhizophagus irregularis DAOM 197198w]EXX67630.1 Nif3p [Rhizophagus irregularis DAOM 197198w]PKC01648.1 NGG1p interacting factor 3 [Rhizophagus irregularis]PKC69415.1 NGG1p interacting factor 3 [Rhizophagus irregularis]